MTGKKLGNTPTLRGASKGERDRIRSISLLDFDATPTHKVLDDVS